MEQQLEPIEILYSNETSPICSVQFTLEKDPPNLEWFSIGIVGLKVLLYVARFSSIFAALLCLG